jgi:hypothetical protein
MIEKLDCIVCTMNEISVVSGLSVETLERSFADTIKKGLAKGFA